MANSNCKVLPAFFFLFSLGFELAAFSTSSWLTGTIPPPATNCTKGQANTTNLTAPCPEAQSVRYGLWSTCNKSVCVMAKVPEGFTISFRVLQVTQCLGLINLLLGIFIGLCSCCCEKKPKPLLTIKLCCILTAMLWGAGVIYLGVDKASSSLTFHFSFYLAAVAALGFLITGFLMFCPSDPSWREIEGRRRYM